MWLEPMTPLQSSPVKVNQPNAGGPSVEAQRSAGFGNEILRKPRPNPAEVLAKSSQLPRKLLTRRSPFISIDAQLCLRCNNIQYAVLQWQLPSCAPDPLRCKIADRQINVFVSRHRQANR
jgi:hypothetical protein